jgi:hypothetical protein
VSSTTNGGSTASLAVAHRYARGTAVAVVLVAALWHTANDIPGVLRFWDQYRSPAAAWLSAGTWLLYTVIGTIASALVLRRRSVRWFEHTALALLLAGVPAVIAAGAPRLTFTAGNWTWGMFGWYALVVLWRRPLRHFGAALAAAGLLVLVSMLLTQPVGKIDLARWGVVVYGTSAVPMVLAVGARLLERDATRAAEAAAAERTTETERLAAETAHQARQRRFQTSGRSAADLLAGLASGALDPADPATRHRSAVEAARLRRLLAEHDDVPDPLLHELRASADVAERRGVLVDLTSVGAAPPLPAQVRRALTDAPVHLLAAARTRAKITVAAGPGEVSIAVIADVADDLDPPPERPHEHIHVHCQREGEQLCLQATWRSPSPSSTTTRWSSRASSRGSPATPGVG